MGAQQQPQPPQPQLLQPCLQMDTQIFAPLNILVMKMREIVIGITSARQARGSCPAYTSSSKL